MSRFLFPRWANLVLPTIILALVTIPVYAVFFVAYGFSPKTLEVGYQPTQPVPFSHALHAGELGMDCRYCHTSVESAAHASVPATQTCMNCHTQIHRESPNLAKVRESYSTGMPIEWIKVHKIGDYAYFNHAAHVTRGVSCVECHGRIDQMEVVHRAQPLSMGWCLNCHRNPVDHVRPPESVFELWKDTTTTWSKDERLGLINRYDIHANEYCSTCHR